MNIGIYRGTKLSHSCRMVDASETSNYLGRKCGEAAITNVSTNLVAFASKGVIAVGWIGRFMEGQGKVLTCIK